jgi:hypothetical protein
MAQKPWIVPIPRTRSLDHLSENVGAVDIVLTYDELREIDAALSTITVEGSRMNEAQMAQVGITGLSDYGPSQSKAAPPVCAHLHHLCCSHQSRS